MARKLTKISLKDVNNSRLTCSNAVKHNFKQRRHGLLLRIADPAKQQGNSNMLNTVDRYYITKYTSQNNLAKVSMIGE